MNRPLRVLLGFLSVWPIIYIVLILVLAISLVGTLTTLPAGAHPPSNLVSTIMGFMVLHVLTIATVIGLEIFYVIQIFRGGRVPKDKQVLWLVLLVLVGIIMLPAFWYLYIWKDPVVDPED